MKTALIAGRFCIRRQCCRSSPSPAPLYRSYFRPSFAARFSRFSSRPSSFFNSNSKCLLRRNWSRSPAVGAALLAALTPIAFLKLAEDGNDDDDSTAELEMLAASREEIRKSIPEDANFLVRSFWRVYIFLDKYVFEVLATGMRFLHLVTIFVPVILTIPVIWLGPRAKGRDNQRLGTIWWFKFLVWSMERAGPAFIKVRTEAFRFLDMCLLD